MEGNSSNIIPEEAHGVLDKSLTYSSIYCVGIIHFICLMSGLVLPLYYLKVSPGIWFKNFKIIRCFNTILLIYMLYGLADIYTNGLYDLKLGGVMRYLYIFDNTDLVETIFFIMIIHFDIITMLFILIVMPKCCDRVGDEMTFDINAENEHAFLIVCHNSSDKIDETIIALITLRIPSYNIFIIDNGSDKDERTTTQNICNKHKARYLCLERGNKTIAQYIGINFIINKSEHRIKYVSLMDDDTRIVSGWSFDHIKKHFDHDELVKCVSFIMRPQYRTNFIEYCQDFEYLLASYSKIAQTIFGGTVMFGSGGFSTWDIEFLYHALKEHDTVFNGEDFQLGIITHSLNSKGYKIIICNHIEIGTIAPVHFIHWVDIPVINRLCVEKCKCGEASLYKQRARSWDVAKYDFIYKYFNPIMAPVHCSRHNIWIKFLFLVDIISVLSDWVSLMYVIVFGVFLGEWGRIFRIFVISSLYAVPLIVFINYVIFRQYSIPLLICLTFSICYKLILSTIVKIDTIIYTFYIYTSTPKPKPIKDFTRLDFREIISGEDV